MTTFVTNALETIKKEVERLQKLADDNAPAFKELKKYPTSDSVGVSFRKDARITTHTSYGAGWIPKSYYEHYVSGLTVTQTSLARTAKEKVLAAFDDTVCAYWLAVKDIRQHNVETAEQNVIALEAVKRFMSKVGINEYTYVTEKKSPRSTKTVTVKKEAAYLTDIKSKFSMEDKEFDIVVKAFNMKRSELEKYGDQLIKQAAEAERDIRLKELEDAKLRAHIELCIKLGVYTDTSSDTLYELVGKGDKYFKLANAMLETRNDWNDGCYKVEIALELFDIANTEDQEIYESILELCEDFEDGRVFRDCKWNYSVLFGMCKEESLELSKLWNIAHGE